MRTERRRYFRIDDTALLKYRVLDTEHLEAARAQVNQHGLQTENLRGTLEPLDTRLTDLLPSLRRESRVVAEAIEILNRKLGLLAGVLALEQGGAGGDPYREHRLSTVNLGGGGLALSADAPLPDHSWLAIELVLLPAKHSLRAIGRVTDCRRRGAEYALGVEFDALREADRDALVSHALRKQAEHLRQRRDVPARDD